MVVHVRCLLMILGLLHAASCDGPRDIRFVEILALNKMQRGTFSLQTRLLRDDMTYENGELRSKNVRLVADAELFNAQMGEQAFNHSSFDDLTRSLQEMLGGEPIDLKVSIDDGVMRSESFESLVAMSALVHLDDVMLFGRNALSSSSPALTLPLTVAVHGQILMSSGYALPLTMDDNAIYAGPVDAIFLLPNSYRAELPLSMNEGVLAHELHHRIFFKEVWANPQFDKLWSLFQSRYDRLKNRLDYRSRTLLNALDEGLADLFAVAYTSMPDYLNVSLPSKTSIKTRQQRDLEGAFAETATYEELSSSSRPDHMLYCNARSKDFFNLDFNVYCLGTVIAKTIYEAAEQNTAKLIATALPLIFASLPSVAKSLNETNQFDLDVFFNELVSQAKLRDQRFSLLLCRQLQLRFASLATHERMPACH